MAMNTYVIRREKAWPSADDLGKTAERSKQVATDEFPTTSPGSAAT